MASTAISAQGTTIQIDATTPGTPDEPIGNVVSYSGFDGESGEIDTTNLDSTAKEFLVGLQDFGQFTMDFDTDYADAGQNDLRDAQASGAIKTFLVTFPDAATAQFTGLVKNATSITGGVDAKLTSSASIKITGDVTFA